MAYCIYLRKSRADLEAETRGEGETLKRHEQTLLELAKKLKLSVTEIYREIVSGETIAARPVMQQLLADVEQGLWEGVLVMEIERLARGDTIDQGIVAQTFKYSGTKIITPLKTYDPNNEYDEEYFEFNLFMSRREYKTINRRMQSGRLASVKEGKWVGNKPPYGYVRKKLEGQKGYTLEPHPEQANIVKLIFELYTKGEQRENGSYERLGVSLIVRKLNELRIPPLKGDVWVPATVQTILRNPVYIGKIRWNFRPQVKKMVGGKMKRVRPRTNPEDWILVAGLHEPIIDMDTWNLAQEYLAENPPKPCPKDTGIKNPLAGIVVCGFCGRRMQRRPYSSLYPETLLCANTACRNVSSRLSHVEDRLLETLEKWLYNYKLNWGLADNQKADSDIQIEIKKKAIKKLDDELATLEKQMDNIHDLLEQGVYSIDKFLERSKLISERINEAKQNRDKLLHELRQEEIKEESKRSIIPKIEKVLEVYRDVKDPEQKNSLLKEVLEKAVYTKTVNGRWHNKADDFELVLYPKLPKTDL